MKSPSGFWLRLVERGVKYGDSASARRNIIFSNYVSLILIGAVFFLHVIVPQNRNLGGLFESLIAAALFALPILFNHWSFNNFSRLYLCWLPPLLVTGTMIIGMKEVDVVPVTAYDGLRIYLVAVSCIPYLLMDRRNYVMFVAGIFPSLFILIFCDFLLDALGVGYSIKGIPVESYAFTSFRSFVAYIVVGGSCFALKFIVDQSEALNDKLISELGKRNIQIKRQTESEVNQLNQQLIANLDHLTKREFTLLKSQEIAKIGSWEYNLVDKSVYWSDQMYEIFGVNRDFNLKDPALTTYLFGEYSVYFKVATRELTQTHKPYNLTLQTKTPLGYIKWVRVSGFPLIENGKVISVSGIVHDITFFKESEILIRTNEKNYRSLFEQASDAIVVSDFRGKIIDVNESSCKMLGYEKSEFLQLTISDLIDPEQLKTSPVQFDLLAMGQQIFSERMVVHKNGSILYMELNARKIDEGRIIAIARDVSNRKQIEKEKEYARYLLRERIKELTALYQTSQLLTNDSKTVHEVLEELVQLLPSGWQFPAICKARIVLFNKNYQSPGFVESHYKQIAEFHLPDDSKGWVEIVYTEERPEEVEGPFLFEERNLLNAVAEMLSVYFVRKANEEALVTAQANLRATINNTEILIWSVDRNFNAITFNEPFVQHVKERYNGEVRLGARLLPEAQTEEAKEIAKAWESYYLRALAGEIVKVEEKRFGNDYAFSLSPIIEQEKIIGVSVFVEDITEKKKRERALVEANHKISEFKVMALRSAMNPHFIFNVLSSIQFFVINNDRLNAINYLSTFSKLIRNILNYSVSDRIRLAEEVSMLNDYLKLERVRFENRFDYSITVNPAIDTQNTEMPALLIQPYVENAILHGLYNKEGKGILQIHVAKESDYLIFEVKDDGVGRAAASLFHKKTGHKSMGTKLTEERLKLLNESSAGVSVEYIDLMEGELPTGTLVKIRVKALNLSDN